MGIFAKEGNSYLGRVGLWSEAVGKMGAGTMFIVILLVWLPF